VILPAENEHDLDDLPPEAKDDLDFLLVDHVEEVFEHAFHGSRNGRRSRPSPLRQAAASRR
jgi:ATP-dependent Lon protease